MKSLTFALITALLCGMATSDSAWAGRGHSGGHRHGHFVGQHHGFAGHHHKHFHRHARLGVVVAAPFFYPWNSWPAPYYAAPQPAPVYVEQRDGGLGQSGYWYYCANPSGYYPEVQECAMGWRKVIPTPAP